MGSVYCSRVPVLAQRCYSPGKLGRVTRLESCPSRVPVRLPGTLFLALNSPNGLPHVSLQGTCMTMPPEAPEHFHETMCLTMLGIIISA